MSDHVVDFFDSRPDAYDRQLWLERRALRTAAAFTGPVAGQDVVDLASGTGALAAAVLSAGGRPASLTAVDASPRMLERARAQGRVPPDAATVVADARAVPLPDACADVVLAGYLLHLIDASARRDVLAEARRLLRPDGTLVVVVHGSPPGPAGRAYRAVWRALYRAAPGAMVGGGPLVDLRPELRAAGFVVEASRRVAGVYWSQVVRARRSGPDRARR